MPNLVQVIHLGSGSEWEISNPHAHPSFVPYLPHNLEQVTFPASAFTSENGHDDNAYIAM